MTRLIDQVLPDGRTVASVVFAPLQKFGGQLEFVDVGARNGSYLLPESYTRHCRISGFEPNRVEYEKLVSGRTDAASHGQKEPTFKDRRYYPYAVWSENTERTLYLTVGPGAVSLMGAVNRPMTENMWRDSDNGKSYFDRHQRPTGTDQVECVALDNLWTAQDGVIDILKLDVEGGELEVLKGARKLLAEQRVLFVFTEFLLVPYYQDRVTLGHQQVFLDELGYRLIAINSDHDGYSWHPTGIRAGADRRMAYAGDAIFVIDPDRAGLNQEMTYRLGLACLAMGFNSFGLNLIRETGLAAAADIVAIEDCANRVSLSRKLKNAWMHAPDYAYAFLRLLGLRP